MLLHDGSKSEDAIHSFFKEAYDLYVKVRDRRRSKGSRQCCAFPPLLTIIPHARFDFIEHSSS